MKAAVTVRDRKIEYVDQPAPVPGPSQVLISVRYAGICGSDIHVYRGEFAPRVVFPLIQGHEFAGVIEEKGSGVDPGLEVGDRVCVDPIISCMRCPACLGGAYNACRSLRLTGIDLNGGFAPYACVDQEQCFKVPESVSDRDAALVEVLSIGMHATSVSRIEPGDRVVVLGSGRVGLAVLQNLLLSAAEKVAVVDVCDEKLEIAHSLGAAEVINSRKEDALQAVARFTGDHYGADCVIECIGEAELDVVGHKPPVEQAVEMVRSAGRITLLGQGPEKYGVHWKTLVWKEATIRTSRTSRGEFPRVIAMMAAGKFKTGPMVSRVYPLSEASEAFSLVDRELPDVVKVMFKVS
ncbi:MAG: alcohol dehydrogenase catalytic domain-containing protein [Gemmatimonadota bacterium]|nr:alcohol dehydrogenase catalytic domain-containing protein [Gemmatimonadota bacterium]